MKFRFSCLFFLLFPMALSAQFSYDLQGHRGARGLMPENTIPAMIKALDLGATTLELDLAVTKDGILIVSHEPYMNPVICLDPERKEIDSNDRGHNIFLMSFEETLAYDCGSKFHVGFPEQVKFHVSKPKLSDLIEVVEKYAGDMGLPLPKYNIEIKSSPEGDGVFHPDPREFAELVYRLVDEKLDWDRVNIQSFDFRVLRHFRTAYPKVTLAMLVGTAKGHESQVELLGFTPHIYSPHYGFLTKETVDWFHEKGMKVIPWTVNNAEEMTKLLDMGVDGIITDYPNRAPVR